MSLDTERINQTFQDLKIANNSNSMLSGVSTSKIEQILADIHSRNRLSRDFFPKLPCLAKSRELAALLSAYGGKSTVKEIQADIDSSSNVLVPALSSDAIVLEGADLDSVIQVILTETWTACYELDFPLTTVLVEESLFEDFVSKLIYRGRLYTVDGLQGRYGNQRIADVVAETVREAQNSGAKVHQLNNPGGLWQPTIIEQYRCKNTGNANPAVSVVSFRTVSEAMGMVQSHYVSIWGGSIPSTLKLADQLDAASVWLNGHGFHHYTLNMKGIEWWKKGNSKNSGMLAEKVLQLFTVILEDPNLSNWKKRLVEVERKLRSVCSGFGLNALLRVMPANQTIFVPNHFSQNFELIILLVFAGFVVQFPVFEEPYLSLSKYLPAIKLSEDICEEVFNNTSVDLLNLDETLAAFCAYKVIWFGNSS